MDKEHKKTILIFSTFYEPFEGGAERYVKEITERLKEKYHFLILTSRLSRKLPKKESKNGIEILRLGLGFKSDKFLYPILAFFKSFFIEKDLIHAILESYAGLALLFYRTFNKETPTLLTLQSGKVSMPNFLFKKIHLAPNKIQAISKFLAKRAQKFGAKDIEVIPNGIELKKFQNLNISHREKYRITCVSHLKKVKGIEYLIEALPEVLKRFPQARLTLIGGGPEEKNLKLKAKNLKLERKIEFKGAMDNEKIPEELTKASVFVLPSLFEGMGISILEAQASGLPVIATNVGGIPDIIEDGKTGILVEPQNSEAIAKAIIKIFSEPGFAKKLVQNAQANLERYDWYNIAQKIDSIYQQLLL